MTNVDIQKSKFNQLASKCFDEQTLALVGVETIYQKRELNCYYAVFSIARVLSAAEELEIFSKKNQVFNGVMDVKFFFDYSSLIEKNREIITHYQPYYLSYVRGLPAEAERDACLY